MARQQLSGTVSRIRLSICAFWSLRARHATTDRDALPTAASASRHSVPQYSIAFSSSTSEASAAISPGVAFGAALTCTGPLGE
eukprot:7094616-Prymnesium_polylepis.1